MAKLDHKDSPINQKLLLVLLVVFIAVSQIFVGWVILYRLEISSDKGPAAAMATPQASPYLDPDLSLALDIADRLQDGDSTNDAITNSLARNNFLKTLVSQMGSKGEIIGGGMSSYEYYTEWYIGGYEGKTGWSARTPWCASYISWCIAQVNLSIARNAPRYANVDRFLDHFSAESWLPPDSTPIPGDLVFFGSNNDPNHMGAVIAVDDEAVYTVEGNTANVVGIRKYALSDETILGYGRIEWKN